MELESELELKSDELELELKSGELELELKSGHLELELNLEGITEFELKLPK